MNTTELRATFIEDVIVQLNRKALFEAKIEFKGDTTLHCSKEQIKILLHALKSEYDFAVLMDLTAVDYLDPPRTKIVYSLHHPKNFSRLRVTCNINRFGSIPTVTDLWAGAHCYEREVFDLFGITFDGHPKLTRILMPDDWIGHPLCRDYALTEESVEFKHGVKPKIPSEIIPNVGTPKNV